MAVARPVRYLGIACSFLVVFLLYTLLRPSPPLLAPGEGQHGEKIDKMERDPLLDRGYFPPLKPFCADCRQLSANLQNHSGEPQSTTIVP